jgi:transposase-like protein
MIVDVALLERMLDGAKELARQDLPDAPAKDETLKNFCCRYKKCSLYGIVGKNNIRVRTTFGNNHFRLLYCRKCMQTFSEHSGTILDNSRLAPEKVVFILKYLAEGKSQREIARLAGVDRSAVSRYAKLAGGDIQKHLDNVTALLTEKQKYTVRQEGGLHPKDAVVNAGEYRNCIDHQVLEMLHTQDSITATAKPIHIHSTRYSVSSLDGNAYPITLFVDKLWDILLLRLTELIYSDGQFVWGNSKKWHIRLSIHDIADSLGLFDRVDLFRDLYDNILTAVEVLRKICVTENDHKIEGYLSGATIKETGDNTPQSSVCFTFAINPALIQYVKSREPGLYRFDACWLHLPILSRGQREAHSRNVYSAAKLLSRHVSQNARGREFFEMEIEDLISNLPYSMNEQNCVNRKSLDKALKVIPGVRDTRYLFDKRMLTFTKLSELKLKRGKYAKVKVVVEYNDLPGNQSKSDSKEYSPLTVPAVQGTEK